MCAEIRCLLEKAQRNMLAGRITEEEKDELEAATDLFYNAHLMNVD